MRLKDSVSLLVKLGRVDGTAVVGESYAVALLKVGRRTDACEPLRISAKVYRVLGNDQHADELDDAARRLYG